MDSGVDPDEVRVVRNAYAALERADLDGFSAALSPQVQWQHPSGFGWPLGGTHLGPIAVMRNVFTIGRQGWASVDHQPQQYLSGVDHVLALGRTVFQSHEGACGAGDFAHLWLVADGEISGVRVFEDTAVAMRHRGPDRPGGVA